MSRTGSPKGSGAIAASAAGEAAEAEPTIQRRASINSDPRKSLRAGRPCQDARELPGLVQAQQVSVSTPGHAAACQKSRVSQSDACGERPRGKPRRCGAIVGDSASRAARLANPSWRRARIRTEEGGGRSRRPASDAPPRESVLETQ